MGLTAHHRTLRGPRESKKVVMSTKLPYELEAPVSSHTGWTHSLYHHTSIMISLVYAIGVTDCTLQS